MKITYALKIQFESSTRWKSDIEQERKRLYYHARIEAQLLRANNVFVRQWRMMSSAFFNYGLERGKQD